MAEGFNEFLSFFLDEALDALIIWEKACLELERDSNLEAREELYRAAHNLKSGSGAVGLTEFNELVHRVEDLIAKVLNSQMECSSTSIKIFLGTHSLLSIWVEKLKAGQDFHPHQEVQDIFQALAAIMLDSVRSEDAGTDLATSGEFLSPVELLLKSLDSPPAAEAEPLILNQREADQTSASLPESRPTSTSAKSQESIRVAAGKLDQLIQLVGELSTQQAIVWHGRQNGSLQSKSCDNAIQLIQKIAKDLQSLALSLRLQPLQNLFQRLERTGRDLARNQQKKIDVVMRGDYVEVDRTIIERIADAMNHVIRNAVDHGIETESDRQQYGKKATATLRIEAVQETSGVMITVADDGRGLNTEKIQKKAIEKGIIRPDAKLSPQEIHRLIFHAGLSTAEKVTDISGRGVGMDVVKNSVETIGGSIHVVSVAQQGTSFAITLPATLSIIDAMIIFVDGSRYAIPVQDVAEIINTSQSRIEAVAGYGRLLSLREKLMPVEALRGHLPKVLAQQKPPPVLAREFADSMKPALIVRGGLEVLAFEVDSILGQQPVTVRKLPHLIANVPGYIGGTILGDGDPCVILNLPALVSRHFDLLNRSPSPTVNPKNEALDQGDTSVSHAIENRFIIFESHGREFGVPLLTIREILRDQVCEPMLGSAPHVLGCIDVRGVLLAVYDLAVILGLESAAEEGRTDIVLEDSESSFALRVNRVSAVANIQVLESHFSDKRQDLMPGLYGYLGTGVFEGRSIVIIDLQKTVQMWEHEHRINSSNQKRGENMLEVS